MLRVGSLFSGIGGIELGLERSGGFETVWFVEREPYAQTVLRKHWPSATIYDDITKVVWEKVPSVDVLTGGFPCQDISNAGKRKGITGERSGLWKEFAKAISILRPRVVFIENVSALLNRGGDVVLCDLASLGYDAEWHCLPARDVGAPHRRDRVFIMAYPNYKGKRGLESEKRDAQDFTGREVSPIGTPAPDYFVNAGNDVSNSSGERWERNGKESVRHSQLSNTYNHDDWKQRKSGFREKNWRETWSVEPDVGRVVDGVPFRVDRIKCLGNAVVPQCAEFFAQRIKEVAR